ncbi:MAG: ABC transporter permease [Bacteroidales bacterium]|nr:ABC transporter permease [Bacteroidales bacterium]
MLKKGLLTSVIVKEVRHIFRDPVSCLLLFLMPALILILFGYALSFEVHHMNIAVMNPSHNVEAERLFTKIDANPKINVTQRIESVDQMDAAFAKHNTRAVVVYDDGIDIFVDGTSPTLIAYAESLLTNIISDFWAEEYHTDALNTDVKTPQVRFLYNPSLKKEYMPVPGLVLMIFILVSSIVLGTSINKEKDHGTFKLMRMTPLTNLQIIAGKSIPYFIISIFHVLVVYAVCVYFGIAIKGSLALFFCLCILYALCCMSLGLLIASLCDKPLEVLILCWIVLFIPNVFLSGFIFSVDSLGFPLKQIVSALPGTAFIDAFRGIAYKGTGFIETVGPFVILITETVLAFFISLIGFRRTLPK